MNLQNCRYTTATTVRNVKGSHTINQYVELNPFPSIPNTTKQIFLIFDFHPFFDGLIGYETLKNLNADIITSKNELTFPKGTIKMKRKYPDIRSMHLNSHETKLLNLPTKLNGEFLLEDDLFIDKNVTIHSGLYLAENEYARVLVTNHSPEAIQIQLNSYTLDPEINNFEICMPPNSTEKTGLKKALFDQLRIDHLNADEKEKLLKVISQHEDIFFIEGTKLTFTSAIKHTIKTKDDMPIHTKSYRYPFCHRDEVKRQISKLLDQGIIRHSDSPWTSPVWIVPKKLDASGKRKWRLVIEYRKLNEKTIDDRYPIPNITDILDKLGRCMYFTTLDLASGFHQVEVNEHDIPKTAFSVENGHYEFLRMPFGLKNAPSTFQRVMDNVLREHIGIICLVYMDDIIVFSTSLTEHLDNLAKIFKTLEKHNLKVQQTRVSFCKRKSLS